VQLLVGYSEKGFAAGLFLPQRKSVMLIVVVKASISTIANRKFVAIKSVTR
jgi:hypothetical protein